jgi:hypothetical protein
MLANLAIHKHPLVPYSGHERTTLALYGSEIYYCNLCPEEVSGGVSYSCNLCNFDACQTCYNYILPKC